MKYTAWLNQHIADLKGKTVLVTGANSGLGFFAAKQLAYRGAHVLMACRNLVTAEEAKKLILLDVPNAILTIIPFDQSSLESIRRFVDHMKVNHPHMDILLLNAGIIMPPRGAKTVDGLPLTTGVNFFNVYYLLREWLGFLDQRNANIRLVFVGSYSAYKPRLKSVQSLLNHRLPRPQQYGLSKLAIAMLHHVFQMNLNLFDFPVIDHVSSILVHPGLASTNIVRDLPTWLQSLIKGLLSLITHSAEAGALSLTYACGHPYITNGQYIGPNGPGERFGFPTQLKLRPHFSKGSAQFTYEVGKYLETIGGKSHVGSR
jgi:NAD(P)-dependent dehydrogenase (short-subunit alcohol dehydrogenase family)